MTLDYSTQLENVAEGVMYGSQITSAPGHQYNPVWLRGSEGSDYGRLLYSTKNQYHKNKKIYDLTIPGVPNLQGSPGEMGNLGGLDSDGEILVTAMRNVEVTGARAVMKQHGWSIRESAAETEFPATLLNGQPRQRRAELDHAPTGYAEDCWDTNFNNIEDSAEDVNQDGSYTKEDCYPHELRGLNIAFDFSGLTSYLQVPSQETFARLTNRRAA